MLINGIENSILAKKYWVSNLEIIMCVYSIVTLVSVTVRKAGC